jgi:cytochrome c-type biogenesis protein CcmH
MEIVRSMLSRRSLLIEAVLFLVALGAAATVTAPPAYAQQPSPELFNHMERIAAGLYCPVCVGVPLNVCETQACEQWRNLIIQKIQNGESDEQIRQYFIDQYGDRVLGAPPPEGFNLGAYLLPLLILIGGAAILFFTMRGWLRTRAPSGVPATIPPLAEEYAERIARELRERE